MVMAGLPARDDVRGQASKQRDNLTEHHSTPDDKQRSRSPWLVRPGTGLAFRVAGVGSASHRV